MDKSTFEAWSLTHAVSMTSLMVALLLEDPSLPGSVELKLEESNPTQPNPPLPPLHPPPDHPLPPHTPPQYFPSLPPPPFPPPYLPPLPPPPTFGSLRSTRGPAPAPPLNDMTPAVAAGRFLCAPPCVCTALCVYRLACGPLNKHDSCGSHRPPFVCFALCVHRLLCVAPCMRPLE